MNMENAVLEGRADRLDECRRLHERLVRWARQRAANDAAEARELLLAEELGIWEAYGYTTMLAYMEAELGYGPHTALERLRVAHALPALPAIAARLQSGDLHHSAVRELTRVATPETEQAWLDAAAGKNLRQVEQLVSGHRAGDLPDDDRVPELELKNLVIKAPPATHALFRQARKHLDAETGERLEPYQTLEAACRGLLHGSDERSTKPPAQVAFTVCRECKRAAQDGSGIEVDVDEATAAMVLCDCTFIGDLDGEAPARTTSSIPANVRRQVLARDHHRCTVPGCRNARYVEVHHLDFQCHGGSHGKENQTTLCFAHHMLLHRGKLIIEGQAPNLTFTRVTDDDLLASPEDSSVPRGTDGWELSSQAVREWISKLVSLVPRGGEVDPRE
jgi:hypothetical protein